MATYNNQRKQLRAKRRAMAIRLLGGKCVNCGSIENLEFDHINNDRDGLRGLVSQLFTCKLERLIAELEKCQLLCKSCHVQKSIIDNCKKFAEHGSISMCTNQRCRCDECRKVNNDYMRDYMRQYRQKMRMA